ncbi:hypothetical protein ThvES_00014460 [Thiovulum sp. ES]|nr:hypothetical protein ThvES_00014460 [Thiovulum sp. ES]
MLKILLLISVFILVYFIFFRKKETNEIKENPKKKLDGEELIPCSVCGTLVTDKEILISNGKYFCSKECLDS